MYRSVKYLPLLIIAVLAVTLSGCSKPNNALSAFEPEIVTTADAFQFQITDAANVTTTVEYTWNNSEQAATVNHSTSTTTGTATLYVFDADGAQVYTSELLSTGTENTVSGTAGQWTIRIVFTDFSGTANFSVERLAPVI